MPPKKNTRAAAVSRYANAQTDEAVARQSVPGNIHEDVVAAFEAKGEQIAALKELDVLSQPEVEETVTLVGPNPRANVTDVNGTVFRDGKAEVSRSLAERYVGDFEGYEIQGSTKGDK